MIIERLVKAIGEEHVYGWYQPCQGDSLEAIVPHLGGEEAYIYTFDKPVEGNTALQFHSRPTIMADNAKEVLVYVTDMVYHDQPFGDLNGHGLSPAVLTFARTVYLSAKMKMAYEGVNMVGMCDSCVIFEYNDGSNAPVYQKADLSDYDAKLAKAIVSMDKSEWTQWMLRSKLPHTIVKDTGILADTDRSKFAKKNIEAAYKAVKGRELEVAMAAEAYMLRQHQRDTGMNTTTYLDTTLALATHETCHSCIAMFHKTYVVLSVEHGFNIKIGGSGLKGIRK